MTDDVSNLILEYLRRLDAKVDRVVGALSDLRTRVGLLDGSVAHLAASIAALNVRLDRIESHLDRIERRLNLTDPAE